MKTVSLSRNYWIQLLKIYDRLGENDGTMKQFYKWLKSNGLEFQTIEYCPKICRHKFKFDVTNEILASKLLLGII